MAYGMPGYRRDSVIEVGFASQKQYISLYMLKQSVLDAHRAELAGLSVGKGASGTRDQPRSILRLCDACWSIRANRRSRYARRRLAARAALRIAQLRDPAAEHDNTPGNAPGVCGLLAAI